MYKPGRKMTARWSVGPFSTKITLDPVSSRRIRVLHSATTRLRDNQSHTRVINWSLAFLERPLAKSWLYQFILYGRMAWLLSINKGRKKKSTKSIENQDRIWQREILKKEKNIMWILISLGATVTLEKEMHVEYVLLIFFIMLVMTMPNWN